LRAEQRSNQAPEQAEQGNPAEDQRHDLIGLGG
jgi:hypothetical protein